MRTPIAYFLVLSGILFAIGTVGVLIRKNALLIFMSVELQLNAVNLALVAFSRMNGDLRGQVLAFFSMVVAAAEVVVGLAIIVSSTGAAPQRERRRREGAPVVAESVGLVPDPNQAMQVLWLVPPLPLVGAVINLFVGKRLGKAAGWLAVVMMAPSFAVAVLAVKGLLDAPEGERLFRKHSSTGSPWARCA